MTRKIALLAAAALTGGLLLAAAPASAQCYEIPEVDDCANPCIDLERAFYRLTGKDLPGDCTA